MLRHRRPPPHIPQAASSSARALPRDVHKHTVCHWLGWLGEIHKCFLWLACSVLVTPSHSCTLPRQRWMSWSCTQQQQSSSSAEQRALDPVGRN